MKTFSIKDVSTQAALNFVESSLIPVSLQLNEAGKRIINNPNSFGYGLNIN